MNLNKRGLIGSSNKFLKSSFIYVRVSSKDQNEERQINALLELKINERDIFINKQSVNDFDREQYKYTKPSYCKNAYLIL